jgi:hypothetical protein
MTPETGKSTKMQNRATETIARLLNGFFEVFMFFILCLQNDDTKVFRSEKPKIEETG